MSWLSAALKRNKLDVLNKIAKPIQAVVNPMLDKIPIVGSIKAGAEAVGNLLPPISKDVASAAAGASGIPGLGAISGALGGSGSDAWMKALAAAQLANAGALGKQSGDYAKKAYDMTSDFWNQRAGLRSQGIDRMLAAKPTAMPNLGKISAAGNPFAPRV